METKPTFTIVTPAFNCRHLLPRNIASVRFQGLPQGQVEHWIIDGGSTDGTVEYLRQQTGLKFISEPDSGLSQAVNKGLQRATGEWIIWLNADDELAESALSQFLEAVRSYHDTYVFCGRQMMFDYEGKLEQLRDGWDYNLRELLGARTDISQASTIVHRTVYDSVGLLDETYRHAMDYEWTVRAMRKFRCESLPFVISHYHRRRGSIMDKGLVDQCRAILRVRRKWGQSRFTTIEWKLRLYIVTEPLRKIVGLRGMVRRVKRMIGLSSATLIVANG